MKYVMFRIQKDEYEQHLPIVFPNILTHSVVAEQFKATIEKTYKGFKVELVSAGNYDLGKGSCYGKSISLGKAAGEHDALIINTFDYVHGIA